MRNLLISTVLAGAFFHSSAAVAADYGSDTYVEGPESSYTNVEFGSGWYIRGDISWNIGGQHQSSTVYSPQFGNSVTTDYSDVVGFRAGVGFQVNPSLRFEASAEHLMNSDWGETRAATFAGSRDVSGLPDGGGGFTGTDTITFDNSGNVTGTTTGLYTSPTAPPIDGAEQITSSYALNDFMVSAYYDMPEMGRFKPYVGAGVGVARVSFSERRILNCQAQANETCSDPAGAPGTPVTNFVSMDVQEDFYEFAYQLSVGTAYALSDQLALDVGYSFMQVGDGPELSYADGTAINTDGVSLHKVHMGLRYEVW